MDRFVKENDIALIWDQNELPSHKGIWEIEENKCYLQPALLRCILKCAAFASRKTCSSTKLNESSTKFNCLSLNLQTLLSPALCLVWFSTKFASKQPSQLNQHYINLTTKKHSFFFVQRNVSYLFQAIIQIYMDPLVEKMEKLKHSVVLGFFLVMLIKTFRIPLNVVFIQRLCHCLLISCDSNNTTSADFDNIQYHFPSSLQDKRFFSFFCLYFR